MGNRKFDISMRKWMNEHPAPCKRCRTRSATCHGSCAMFAEWTRKKDEARDIEYKNSKPIETAFEKESNMRFKASRVRRKSG